VQVAIRSDALHASLLKMGPSPLENSGFLVGPRLPENRVNPRALAMTNGPSAWRSAHHTRARARAREIIEEFRAATITQSFLAGLEIANRRITSLPQDDLDSLQHQIMNLRALIKGNLAQRFVDRCWKV
jgi:hypothetical protein